jgi:hypothetical protein
MLGESAVVKYTYVNPETNSTFVIDNVSNPAGSSSGQFIYGGKTYVLKIQYRWLSPHGGPKASVAFQGISNDARAMVGGVGFGVDWSKSLNLEFLIVTKDGIGQLIKAKYVRR